MAELDGIDVKPKPKTVPYKIVVQYEITLRVPEDFWRFRTATNVLRQNSLQIENYRQRYQKIGD